jgi:hypothetical protein
MCTGDSRNRAAGKYENRVIRLGIQVAKAVPGWLYPEIVDSSQLGQMGAAANSSPVELIDA